MLQLWKIKSFAKVCRSKPSTTNKQELVQKPVTSKHEAANQIAAVDPISCSDDEYMYSLSL